MRARPRPRGWLLNGNRYSTEAAYVEALRSGMSGGRGFGRCSRPT